MYNKQREGKGTRYIIMWMDLSVCSNGKSIESKSSFIISKVELLLHLRFENESRNRNWLQKHVKQ